LGVIYNRAPKLRAPRAATARSTGRWVGLAAGALITAAGLLATPSATPVAHADCPDAQVVFARGTNEDPGLGRVGDAFADSLRQQTNGMNISTYGVNYAASKLQIHTGDGANDAVSYTHLNTSTPNSTSVPITTAATPRPPDPHARNTAFGGAAICLVGLLTVLTIGAAKGGLRRSRDRVPGD